MPSWLRVILILLATGVVLLAAMITGGYYWFKRHGPATLEAGRKIEQEGKEFGRKVKADSCLARALQIARPQSGFRSQMRARLFLDGCLETAARDAGTCEGVPSPMNPFKVTLWGKARCETAGRDGDPACEQIMQALPPYCHAPTERVPDPGDAAANSEASGS